MTAGRNQLKRRLGPGVWEDVDGGVHFSVPELIKHFGLPETQAMREEVHAMCLEMLKTLKGVEVQERKGACPKCGGMLRITEKEETARGELCCYKCGQYCAEAEVMASATDLFGSHEKVVEPEPVLPRSQWVSFECSCGRKAGQYLEHYDIVVCGKCGAKFWALRPKGNGPMRAFPWPGCWQEGVRL